MRERDVCPAPREIGGPPFYSIPCLRCQKKGGGGVDQDFLKFQTRRGNGEYSFLIDFLGFNVKAKKYSQKSVRQARKKGKKHHCCMFHVFILSKSCSPKRRFPTRRRALNKRKKKRPFFLTRFFFLFFTRYLLGKREGVVQNYQPVKKLWENKCSVAWKNRAMEIVGTRRKKEMNDLLTVSAANKNPTFRFSKAFEAERRSEDHK